MRKPVVNVKNFDIKDAKYLDVLRKMGSQNPILAAAKEIRSFLPWVSDSLIE